MYTQFYGLREKPFALSPDPRFLFLSVSHREALAHLLYGIEQGEGFIAITGEVGTGKTTLCRTLLQRLEPGSEVAFIFNPPHSGLELLQAIAGELGLEGEGRDRWELMEALNRFLLAKRNEERRVLLIVDEAQNLPADALEQVRLLSNLETDTSKLIQILLIGQPELDAILDAPGLRQLRQRVSVRWRLRPLTASETRRYVRHRLRIAAGAERDLFTELALREIHRCSRGIPRLVNLLCDRSLLAGYAAGAHTVGLGLVSRTERELRGAGRPVAGAIAPARMRPPLRRALVAGALLVAAGAALAWAAPIREAGRALLGRTAGRSEPAVAAAPVGEASAVGGAEEEAGRGAGKASSDPEPEGASASSGVPESADVPGPFVASDGAGRVEGDEVEGRSAEATTAEASEARPDAAPSPGDAEAGAPAPAPDDLGTALARSSPARTAAASVDALLQAWGTAPLGEELLPPGEAAARLREAGLALLPLGEGGWPALERYDSPALLRLRALDGAPRLAALTAIAPDGSAILQGLGGAVPRRVAPAELTRHWDGRAWISWRDFEELPAILRPGSRGEAVRWLQGHLAELGLYGEAPSGSFDPSTVIAVRALQERLGVEVDGTVGPRTKLRLYEELASYPVPRLREDGDRTDPSARERAAAGEGSP